MINLPILPILICLPLIGLLFILLSSENDENSIQSKKSAIWTSLSNFLLSLYKNVPKTKIYKVIRKGEVRVNSSRTKPHYKLRINDLVRIPPIIDLNKNIKKNINNEDVDIHMSDILYEDQNFLIINKKRGIVVHGGSKI